VDLGALVLVDVLGLLAVAEKIFVPFQKRISPSTMVTKPAEVHGARSARSAHIAPVCRIAMGQMGDGSWGQSRRRDHSG
jgi:hypothetical protein